MSDDKKSTTFFIKDEASYSLESKDVSNYLGCGIKSQYKFGNIETMVAFKNTKTTLGGFGEVKYTSNKLNEDNWAFESRTRVHIDKNYDDDSMSKNLTQRMAFKGNWKLDKNTSLYEIIGINSKISLENGGLKSLTPTSITGVGYNVNKNLNLYAEGEISKTFNMKSWENIKPSLYIGAKYTF